MPDYSAPVVLRSTKCTVEDFVSVTPEFSTLLSPGAWRRYAFLCYHATHKAHLPLGRVGFSSERRGILRLTTKPISAMQFIEPSSSSSKQQLSMASRSSTNRNVLVSRTSWPTRILVRTRDPIIVPFSPYPPPLVIHSSVRSGSVNFLTLCQSQSSNDDEPQGGSVTWLPRTPIRGCQLAGSISMAPLMALLHHTPPRDLARPLPP